MTSTLVHIESYWISWWSVLLRWRHNKPFHGIEICGWMWVTIGALSQYSATLPHVWPPGSAQWEPSRLLGSPHPSERTSTRGLFWYILNYIKYMYVYVCVCDSMIVVLLSECVTWGDSPCRQQNLTPQALHLYPFLHRLCSAQEFQGWLGGSVSCSYFADLETTFFEDM